jgi:stage II sporulation protein D
MGTEYTRPERGFWFIGIIFFVLTLNVYLPNSVASDRQDLIRIGLAEGIGTVAIESFGDASRSIKVTDSAGQTFVLDSNQTVVFSIDGSAINFENCSQKGEFFKIELQPEDSLVTYLSYGGKRYRGTLEVRLSNKGGLVIINELPIEQYLYGVVPREMSPGFPQEALKAQAIAARTYTYANIYKHKADDYNLCLSTHCQVYGGASQEDPRTNAAVDNTRGQVLTYNGNLISAFYHASSGGHTENAENVWSNPLPYLKGVEDYDQAFPRYTWDKTLTAQEIEEGLKKSNLDVGEFKTIEPCGGNGVSGRPISIRITGSRGSIEMKSSNFRTLFDLPSTLFEIEQSSSNSGSPVSNIHDTDKRVAINSFGQKKEVQLGNSYLISSNNRRTAVGFGNVYFISGNNQVVGVPASSHQTTGVPSPSGQVLLYGRGWGHGIGMSQWGAYGLAEMGYNYDQILKHYYQGVTVQNW